MIKRLAFGEVRQTMVDRFAKIVTNTMIEDVFASTKEGGTAGEEVKTTIHKKNSSMATAFMKAVCYTRGWIEEISKSGGAGQQFSARILIIKSSHEDPAQHKAIVNSIFAC